jgi:hypothetical protein
MVVLLYDLHLPEEEQADGILPRDDSEGLVGGAHQKYRTHTLKRDKPR